MKPVTKPPPTGKNSPKTPVQGATGMARRFVKYDLAAQVKKLGADSLLPNWKPKK